MRACPVILCCLLAGCRHAPCGPACPDPTPCRWASSATPTARAPACQPDSPWCPRPAEVEIRQQPARVRVIPADPVKVCLPEPQVVVQQPQATAMSAMAPMPQQLMQTPQQMVQGMQPVGYNNVLAVPPTRLALTWDAVRIPIPFPRMVALPLAQQVVMQAPAPAMAAYQPMQAMYAAPVQQVYAQQVMPAQAMLPPQQVIQPVIQPVIHNVPAAAPLAAAPLPAAPNSSVSDYCSQLDRLEAAIQASRAAMCPPAR